MNYYIYRILDDYGGGEESSGHEDTEGDEGARHNGESMTRNYPRHDHHSQENQISQSPTLHGDHA